MYVCIYIYTYYMGIFILIAIFIVFQVQVKTAFFRGLLGHNGSRIYISYHHTATGCYARMLKMYLDGAHGALTEDRTCRTCRTCWTGRRSKAWNIGGIPSGELTVCNWKWPFIVDFPIKNGGSFHCKMLVHQRVLENRGRHIGEIMMMRTVIMFNYCY